MLTTSPAWERHREKNSNKSKYNSGYSQNGENVISRKINEETNCQSLLKLVAMCLARRWHHDDKKEQESSVISPLRQEVEMWVWFLTGYTFSGHLHGSRACMSGLSRTLWGRLLLWFGPGLMGMLAVPMAVGCRTVSTGFGVLDLTAVWAAKCTGGRGGGAVVTEHTTKWKVRFKSLKS